MHQFVSVLCSFTAGRARPWWWHWAYLILTLFMDRTFSVNAKLIEILMEMVTCWFYSMTNVLRSTCQKQLCKTQNVAPYNYKQYVYYIHNYINAELILERTWTYYSVNGVLCLKKFNFIFLSQWWWVGKIRGGKLKKYAIYVTGW